MAPNYYAQGEYISNSDLSALRDCLLRREKPKNLKAIYDFGNLVDAMLTEPILIQKGKGKLGLWLSDGTEAVFTEKQYQTAQRMVECAMRNQHVAILCKSMEFQAAEYKNDFLITSPAAEFTLPVRCKLDIRNKALRMGGDFKSTAAHNRKAFLQSLDYFDYDRQAAWYMDICGLDYFWWVGIRKTADRQGDHNVYTHVIERGDPLFVSGQRKYQHWAFMYHMLIYNLNPKLLILNANTNHAA